MAEAEDDVQWADDDENPLPIWLEGDSLAPPCQADFDVVAAILRLAEVTAEDCVYDLGCGDGRICVAAAKLGASAVGVEIEPELVAEFEQAVQTEKLQDRVRCVCGDLLEMKLDDATVVAVYLLPEAVAKVQPMLLECLERGAKVVCNSWGLDPAQFKPTETHDVADKGGTRLMLYTKASILVVPAAGGVDESTSPEPETEPAAGGGESTAAS